MFLFADDSKFRSSVLDDLQNDLNQCIQWAIDKQMTYNLNKIQFIIFGRQTDSVLLFGDIPVNPSKSVIDLGITISHYLKWKSHIEK